MIWLTQMKWTLCVSLPALFRVVFMSLYVRTDLHSEMNTASTLLFFLSVYVNSLFTSSFTENACKYK